MKQFLKIRNCYLVFLLLMSIVGCQNDETVENQPTEVQRVVLDFKAKKIKGSTLFQQNKDLDRLLTSSVLNNDLRSEDLNSSLYDFTIDTTNVQIISSDTFDSYTFIVEREETETNVLENYILTMFNDGSYAQMLLSYPFSVINDEKQYDFDNATGVYIVDNSLLIGESDSPCPSTTEEIIAWEDGGCIAVNCGEGKDHSPGEVCDNGEYNAYWHCSGAWVVTGCVYNSGGLYTGTGDPSNSTTNGGGNNNNNTDNFIPNEEIPVIPLMKTALEEIIDCMNNGSIDLYAEPMLTNAMIVWLSNNRVYSNLVNQFLKFSNCSDESINIARLAIETLINNGGADFNDFIFKDETFKDSDLDCIHKSLLDSENFYSKMISKFYDNSGTVLTYEIGEVPVGEWAITKGYSNELNIFDVRISPSIESSSNLSKKITLCHEVVHSYMFNTLKNWGYIQFDVNGNPILSLNCESGINYNNINLNELTTKERFVAIICKLSQNSVLNDNWTHELFGLWHFDVNVYVDKIKDFLLNNHDWDSEATVFKNEAISIFGNMNWKEEVATAISWIGLEGTSEYLDYLNNYSAPANFLKLAYISQINQRIQTAKNNCP
ncbi:hypothetical protein [Kordia sp.]|uniref:hypothetical protein n=1 Tax=Kordia sp. TaxID=1965332 RepID=UPI003D28C0FC